MKRETEIKNSFSLLSRERKEERQKKKNSLSLFCNSGEKAKVDDEKNIGCIYICVCVCVYEIQKAERKRQRERR